MTPLLASFLLASALADTWGPVDTGFISATRLDAPTDAQLVYGANFEPEAQAVAGPDTPFDLDSRQLTGVGAPPRVVLSSPEGWEASETYTLSVLGYYGGDSGGDPPTELTFTVGADPAPDAQAPVVGEVTLGPWSEDEDYAWGCCLPTRTMEVEVEVPDADMWAYVELVGEFDLGRASQITEQPIHTHLDVGLGPGPHLLGFQQWEENGLPQPPCFEIASVSASGVSGPLERVCTTLDDTDDTVGTTGCGCGTSSSPVPASAAWVLLGLLWRRRSAAAAGNR